MGRKLRAFSRSLLAFLPESGSLIVPMSFPAPFHVIEALNGGFFANLNNVMSVLHDRHVRGTRDPVHVDWTIQDRFTDFRYAPVGQNAWLRFFEPLSDYTSGSETVPAAVFPDWTITHVQAYWLYTGALNPGWRERYHALFHENIHIHSDILGRVSALRTSALDGHYAVGVHLRHPGHSVENLFPIPRVKSFIAHTHRLLGDRVDGKVFLATDRAAAVEAFEREFGDRLVVQPNVVRAALGSGQAHISSDQAGVEMGSQVLVDALTMASCDVLLHVTSNIATAAGYINPHLRMVYCENAFRRQAGRLMSRMAEGRISRLRKYAWLLRRLRANP